MRYALLLLLLWATPAVAQTTVEEILKKQLGELAFNIAVLQGQIEQSKGQLNSCQAIVAERDRQLKEKPDAK